PGVSNGMSSRACFIPRKRIERAALQLLDDYRQRKLLAVPVPVEDILERHLGLCLSFDDLTDLLGLDDVLGATFLDTKEGKIDHSLNPDENAEMCGRYRFTLAHEIGHWQLHRELEEGPAAAGPIAHPPANPNTPPAPHARQ